MNIARMEKFEQLWSIRHDLPAESLVQYRFESREGYRLPELAAHYRTFVETWDLATAEASEPCDGCFMAEAESLRKQVDTLSEWHANALNEASILRKALRSAADSMWKSEANMDVEASDAEEALAEAREVA